MTDDTVTRALAPAGIALTLLIVATTVLPTAARALECRYDVVVSDAIASELSVTIECDGGLPRSFVMEEGAPAWAGAMTLSDGDVEIEPDGERWLVPPGTRDGTAHYTLALRAMVETMGRYVGARKIHDAVYANLHSWLAQPEPSDGYTLSIGFDLPDSGDIATALPRDGERYWIAANDVHTAGETVFGTFERQTVEVPAPGALAAGSDDEATIDLVILRWPTNKLGKPWRTSTTQLAEWVESSGRAVAEFWGGFPVDRALLLLVATEGRWPTRGWVSSSGGITILVLVGIKAERDDLYQDWVLIHEMLHLGTPFMNDTGKWLSEGIATFYEPIVRMRAGWSTREEVWQEWIEWMPNGLKAMGEVGLKEAEGGGIYWGGALFLLLAEIDVRERTELKLGVEDCLRAVRDGGGTTERIWTTRRFLDVCDKALGGTTLNELAARHLDPGEPPDLNALWVRLGVSLANGEVRFDDAAPLAAVRDAILSGGPDAEWQPVPIPAP